MNPHGTGATISTSTAGGFLKGGSHHIREDAPATMFSKKAAYKEAIKSNRPGFKTSRTLFPCNEPNSPRGSDDEDDEGNDCIKMTTSDGTFEEDITASFKLNEA